MGPTRRLKASILYPLIPVLLGLLLFSPFFSHGVPNTADGLLHLYRTVLWSDAWASGDFWPRWHTLLYQGWGYPLFDFYAPLLYIVGSLASIGQSANFGLKVALLLACVGYPLGMWLWARDIYGRLCAVVAATAWTFAAFRFRELFIQGNYAQFAAWAIYPWLFFTWRRLAVSPGRWAFLGTVTATAALLLMHNISAMLVAPALGAYVLWQAIENRRSRPWARMVLAGVCALLIGMAFWLPALRESALTRVHVLTHGYFDVAGHFITLREIVAAMVAVDERAANPILPYNAGRVLLVLALIGALTLTLRTLTRRVRGHLIFATAATLIAGFMMVEPSLPVWKIVPYIAFAEFPTRLYGVGGVFAALLAGASLIWVDRWPRVQTVAAILAVFALILEVAAYQFPRTFLPVEARIDGFLKYESGYNAPGTTSASEYLSQWVSEIPPGKTVDEDGTRMALWEPPQGVTATVEAADAQSLRIRVLADAPAAVALAQLYFPGWSARVGGAPVDLSPCTDYGLICLAVPAGESVIDAVYEGTTTQHVGMWLAIAGILLTIVVLLIRPLHRKPAGVASAEAAAAPGPDSDTQSGAPGAGGEEGAGKAEGTVLALVSLLAVLLVVKVVWVAPHTHLFRTASAPGYVLPAQHHVDTAISPDVTLLGWDLTEPAARQGDALDLRLYWQATQRIEREYSSFAQLIGGADQREFAGTSSMHPGDMPTTAWNPDYYVIDDMTIEVPADAMPILYTLRVGMALRGQQERVGQTDLPTRVRVLPAHPVTQKDVRNPVKASFAGGPTLAGYEIGATTTHTSTGEVTLPVTLYWNAGETPAVNPQIFIHAVDAAGNLIAQSDGAAYGGLYPVADWSPGEIVRDERMLTLPQGAQPAALQVGLYDLATLQRLPVTVENGLTERDQAVQIPLENAQ